MSEDGLDIDIPMPPEAGASASSRTGSITTLRSASRSSGWGRRVADRRNSFQAGLWPLLCPEHDEPGSGRD